MTSVGPAAVTALEQRWRAVAPPEWTSSAAAVYERTRLWNGGHLPFVDVPYDARQPRHWADAARVADYAAALPPCEGHVPVIVDIGPGDGWPSLPLANALPEARVLGIDPAPRRARVFHANARRLALHHALAVVADAASLPLATGSVDLVTAAMSLEEAADPHAAFREIARVLRPGGVLRASYQVWRLAAPVVETVSLLDATDGLLYGYTVRTQEPPRERRYLLLLPRDGEAAAMHTEALVAAADAPRAYGETLLRADSALGAPLLDRLAPLALRSLAVEVRRWTTGWLLEALRGAGFAEVRATQHPGDLARGIARRLLARNETEAMTAQFAALTRAIGEAAGALPGEEMVTATR